MKKLKKVCVVLLFSLYDTAFNCKFLKQRCFICTILIILNMTITWDRCRRDNGRS